MAFRLLGLASSRRGGMAADLICVVTGLVMLAAWPALSQSPATLTAGDVARRFCAAPPIEANVTPGDAVNSEASVQVSNSSTSNNPRAPSLTVGLGDVVKVNVFSDRAGPVGVHGLSTVDAIHPGESVVVRFRAIYSGRFPLHFHGTDGSHFELIAINVTAAADLGAPG